MSRKRSVRRQVGDVVSIDLGGGRYGFGMVLKEPVIGYFNYASREPSPPIEEIKSHPLAFKICTMNHAVTRGTWPVIGRVEVPASDAEPTWFFKEDPFTHKLSKTRDGDEEFPVTKEEAATMERAAVWDPVHVVDRLRDHFAGVPNKWVESMKPRYRSRS